MILNSLRWSRKAQHFPKLSKIVQIIKNYLIWSKIFQNCTKLLKWSKKGSRWPKMAQNGPKRPKMVTNGPKRSRLVQHGPIWSKMLQMVQYGPKSSKKSSKWVRHIPATMSSPGNVSQRKTNSFSTFTQSPGPSDLV